MMSDVERLRQLAQRGRDAKLTFTPQVIADLESAADRIEYLEWTLWSMAANKCPQHPDDTHVEVLMPVEVWQKHRP